MKILHFITSLKFGGAESALYNYLEKVVTDKQDQHFVAYIYEGPNVDKIKRLGVPVFKLSGRLLNYSPLIFFRLKRLLKMLKPDIIHSSLWSANIISRVMAIFDKVPLVCDLHGSSFDEGKFRNFLDRLTVSYPAKIIAVSDSVKDSYLKNIIDPIQNSLVKRKVTQGLIVIKNGIDFESIRTKALCCSFCRFDIGISEDDFVVGSVGRLEPIKSYDILINAFAEFVKMNERERHRLKLIIVGGGSQLLHLKKLANDLGLLGNIFFTGFRKDPYCFYSMFSCFAISSKSEGLSISLLEAISFGLPVISTHPQKNHDVIKHGINGFLVEPGATTEYAELINLIYSSRALRSQIYSYNLKLTEEFSIEKVVSKYKENYHNVLRKI